MIEHDFDIPFVANLAVREKQIQQNYRPVIAVHKWFARRPGTLFRSLLLTEFESAPLAKSFYQGNDLKGIRVIDPFMGGGTPVLEANRLGCSVVGYDINPMAYWIVKQETASLDLKSYAFKAQGLMRRLLSELGQLYVTRCLDCGAEHAAVKYFLWVKVQSCRKCSKEFDLFPGYLVAADSRHPKNVVACWNCGELTEVRSRESPGRCRECGEHLTIGGPARNGSCPCPHCGERNPYPAPNAAPPRHRLYAIEYHCKECHIHHRGRYFKRPDAEDTARFASARGVWMAATHTHVPDDEIPPGDETDRLLRWGYGRYREMFNERQLLGLELACRSIEEIKESAVRDALRTNLSDLLRYQNMLCRYDTVALKSLDIFSVHGFPVGLVQCESNMLGVRNEETGACVGSGGWANIVDKYMKAKAYCERPFEYSHDGARRTKVMIPGEWIGTRRNGTGLPQTRELELHCGDAAAASVSPGSVDAVLTDPPYFGNVQYAELMDFCYVWLRRLAGSKTEGFARPTTRSAAELTGNSNMGRGLAHFAEGLSATFRKMAVGLKRGSPFVFTYHHNSIDAYLPIAVAMLDAGLTCSASLPCPAEMGASIHISGTKSSIIDTVFVCRTTGRVPRRWLAKTPDAVASLVDADLMRLSIGGVRATDGDARCIAAGHLVRLAVWNLRKGWRSTTPVSDRMDVVNGWIRAFGGLESVMRSRTAATAETRDRTIGVRDKGIDREVWDAQVSF